MEIPSVIDTGSSRMSDTLSTEWVMALKLILVVEDDEGLAELFKQALSGLSLPVKWVRTGKEAIAALTSAPDALVLLDYALPDMNAATLVEALAKLGPTPPFIAITGHGDERVAVSLMKLGAQDYLIKDTQVLDRLPIVVDRAIRDIQTRRDLQDSERKRLQNERELAIIYNHIPTPILVLDAELRVIKVNAAAVKLVGLPAEEILSLRPGALFDCAHVTEHVRGCGVSSHCPDCPLRHCVLNTLVSGEPHHQVEVELVRGTSQKNNSFFLVSTVRLEIEGRSAVLVCMEDITERKQSEAKLLRSQRMESVGRLSSGIAHDLNNVLAPILMVLPLLREEAASEDVKHYVDTIEASANRGVNIVKQVLTFGRGAESEAGPVQLRHLVKEMAQIIRETFPKSITLEGRCPSDLWVINGDATQLHQVLMNLCLNARDAMPKGGRIILGATNIQMEKSQNAMVGHVQPGPYVLLTIADTGTGISADNVDKIFDPFFTTKEPGKGTGLGLSSVLGIVKGHGGAINVVSLTGRGTTFEIYIPASPEFQSASPDSQVPFFPQGRGQTILVVDDEESIREITSEVLSRNGYQVITAVDGSEGLAIFSENQGSIGLILSDYMMPKMDGLALAQAVRKLAPHVKIIISSGVSENFDETHIPELESAGVAQFLMKPYSAQTLLTLLRDHLG